MGRLHVVLYLCMVCVCTMSMHRYGEGLWSSLGALYVASRNPYGLYLYGQFGVGIPLESFLGSSVPAWQTEGVVQNFRSDRAASAAAGPRVIGHFAHSAADVCVAADVTIPYGVPVVYSVLNPWYKLYI